MFAKPKNRYQAFAVHLCISLIIFLALSAIIVFIWYPGFLFHTDGGWDGIKLVAGVDFIIGPTLTLMVYKVGKRGLKLDLMLIALVQATCLAIGTWIVYMERPMVVFYQDGTYHAESANFFNEYNVKPEQVFSVDDHKPAWIYIDLPGDEKEKMSLLLTEFKDGPLYSRPKLYKPYRQNLDKVMKQALKPEDYEKKIKINGPLTGKIFRYVARYGDGYVEINPNTGEIINVY